MARTKVPGRREALLAAGQRVLAERGAEKATIDEVVAAAGVAKGTFYLYFRSKSDLVAALRRQFAQELADVVAGCLAEQGPRDWPGLTRRLLESAASAYLTDARSHDVALYHGDAGEGEAEWPEEIVAALARFIVAGTAAGAFAVDDPELTAVLIFHAVHGMFHRALHRSKAPDRQRLLAAAWQLVSRTLSC
jgi:AcrR family transcriptional regulator